MFVPGVAQSKDAVLFAARPGLRLWKAGIDGVVQATYIFRDLLKSSTSGLTFIHDTTLGIVQRPEQEMQFGPLHIYEDTNIVTFLGSALFVIDPGLGAFIGYHGNLGTILDVSVCGDEIFVLRRVAGRVLLRLARSREAPHIPQGM